MADSSAPVSSAAQPNAVPGTAPAADNALPKSPLAKAPADKPAEATSTSVGGAVPLPLAPETTKQAGAPTTEASGTTDAPVSNSNGVNGTTTAAKFEPVVPEEKKADTAAPAPAVENPASSAAVPGESASESAAPTQAPVMTGALGASEPKPAESTNDDGVKDATSATKPAELNGANDKDIEMKDSAPAAPAPAIPEVSSAAPAAPEKTAPGPAATTDPDSNIEASTTTAETGEKRKVEATGTNGSTAAEEPAEKKQKQGVVSKVVEKAKEVVEEVKEKAEGGSKKDNGPTRKASKKGKKEAAPVPVGRTARKTRSQGNAD